MVLNFLMLIGLGLMAYLPAKAWIGVNSISAPVPMLFAIVYVAAFILPGLVLFSISAWLKVKQLKRMRLSENQN